MFYNTSPRTEQVLPRGVDDELSLLTDGGQHLLVQPGVVADSLGRASDAF